MENDEQKKKSYAISVSITPEMKGYLDKHPNLKQSAVFQNAMKRIMNPRKNPLLLLLGVLGVCFSVICISVASSGLLLLWGKEGFIVNTALFCVGFAVLTTTVLIYFKNKKSG